jgi:5-methylcytosine-specific restriction endonuclease McrA
MLIKKNEQLFEIFPEISLRSLINKWEAFQKETEEWEKKCQEIKDSCTKFNDNLMHDIIPEEEKLNSNRNYEINEIKHEIDSIGESLIGKSKEHDEWIAKADNEKDVFNFFSSSNKKHALKQAATINHEIRYLITRVLSLSGKLQQYTGGYRCLHQVHLDCWSSKNVIGGLDIIKDLLTKEKRLSEVLPEVSCRSNEYKKYKLHHSPIRSNTIRYASLGRVLPCYRVPEFKYQESTLRTRLKKIVLPKRPNSVVELKRGKLKETINLRDQDFDINIVRKVIEKKEQERAGRESVNALAAAHLSKTRSLAGTIKKGLESQMRIFNLCPYCEKPLDDDVPHADHIYPVSQGGLSTRKNMVYICSTCNMKKTNKTLREFIRDNKLDRYKIEKNLELLKKSF